MEFIANTKDLKRTINLILSGRKGVTEQDCVDISLSGENLELRTTGSSSEFSVKVVKVGGARLPLTVLKQIKKVLPTFHKEEFRIRIEAGLFRLETFSVSHPDIATVGVGPRFADLAVDASVMDTLAIDFLYSAEEIAESGLTARVLAAKQTATAAIDKAAEALKVLGIERDSIKVMIEEEVKIRASEFASHDGVVVLF